VILLGAVLVFLGAFLLLWWAFAPRDEWHLDDREYTERR